MITRRCLIIGAPAIVAASSLMPVRNINRLLFEGSDVTFTATSGFEIVGGMLLVWDAKGAWVPIAKVESFKVTPIIVDGNRDYKIVVE